jgi:hypothetical protein
MIENVIYMHILYLEKINMEFFIIYGIGFLGGFLCATSVQKYNLTKTKKRKDEKNS